MRQNVPNKAQPFFMAMHPADQLHALNVAGTAGELMKNEMAALDEGLLLRCALLHDIGREQGAMDVWGKVWAVLAQKCLPPFLWKALCCKEAAHFWQKPGYALYVFREHPRMGAEKLRSVGMDREADIILRHHEPPSIGEPRELTLLRRADEMN